MKSSGLAGFTCEACGFGVLALMAAAAGDTDIFRPDEQPIPEYRPDSIPRCKA